MYSVMKMITYVHGDLLTSPAQVLVNTVNTDGVMGKGIALKFKKKYPDMFKKYQKYCNDNLLDIGKLWIYDTGSKQILNFPTKRHWRNKSEYSYIESGLKKFVESYQEKGITSIAFPKLGCGNGGLEWSEVKGMMERYLGNLPIDIYVYEEEYRSEKEYENAEAMINWIHKDAKNLPFYEFKEDLCILLGKDKASYMENKSYDHELQDMWNKLRNGEIYVLDQEWMRQSHSQDIIEAIKKLKYIEICKINAREGETLTEAFQIKRHKNKSDEEGKIS